MKAVMLMFDSLNRHMLPCYNADTWVKAPNFRRLAQRAVTFDKSYVCSMPCMPARRDFHTGRPNFLHCGWGPLEPFDDSVPQMLSERGVYTHMDTDHYHYFEDGGATYHNRYNSWTCHRGQEGDSYIGQVAEPIVPANINDKGRRSDWVNRPFQQTDAQMPQTRTLRAGLDFIDRNHGEDRWFLQIECFDPHEPFSVAPEFRKLYPQAHSDVLFDWPGYREVTETPEQVADCRHNYAALLSRCDKSLGDVLDAFDRHNLWEDTMLIVWTDHGFMLGEHGCWAKNWMPMFEEVSHTPFFVFDPRPRKRGKDLAGQRRSALVQPAIDLGPTLLRFFGVEPTADMLGHDLAGVIADDTPVREAAIFGYFNHRLNVTDGRYVLYKLPSESFDQPMYAYTLMPTNMRGFKGRLAEATLAEPFAFTKGLRPLAIPNAPYGRPEGRFNVDLLFDLQADPKQEHPLDHPEVEQRLLEQAAALMAQCNAPAEAFERMGMTTPVV